VDVRRVIVEARQHLQTKGDPNTVAVRLNVVDKLASEGYVEDCARFRPSKVTTAGALAEIASAIGNGLQRKKNRYRLGEIARRASGRARQARRRAKKAPTVKRTATAIASSNLAKSMNPRQRHDAARLFAHAELYQYFCLCGYLRASSQERSRMDDLMLELLNLFQLSRVGDRISFLRQRRRLMKTRPRLFPT
jgi:hypothetical protein